MSFNDCQNVLNNYGLENQYKNSFLNYVYNKISRNTKNRFVDITHNSVDILLSNHPCIKVIPICKDMDKKNIDITDEIEMAKTIISKGDFSYIYFVYPKNNNFDKHIQVKLSSLEHLACSDYMVKLIPYSLNDLKKNKKGKCNGNSNILC